MQPCDTIEGAVFCVGVLNNPFNRVIVRENGRSSSNGMDTRIHDSLVGGLVILNVQKIIVFENGVYPRPIYLVGFTDSATSIRKKMPMFGSLVSISLCRFLHQEIRDILGLFILLNA